MLTKKNQTIFKWISIMKVTGVFPSCVLLKKREKQEYILTVSNYRRPVSLLFVFSKIFDKVCVIGCMFLHVTYAFQSESILYSCLNVKELLAQSRRQIWSLSDCNWTRTHNHLVRKRTFNHLAKLVECSFTN